MDVGGKADKPPTMTQRGRLPWPALAAAGLLWFGSLEPREPIQRRHSSGQLLFAQIRIHGDPCDRL